MRQYIAFIFTAIILMVLVIISATFQVKTEDLTLTEQKTVITEEVYVLKNDNGRLAVFHEDETEPIITTDTLIENLPYQDQEKLKQGINVTGDKNLRIALEDYCS
ncbi:MAG: hypothetical protein IJV39_05645 [Ruminococcus sp.]|nr:hypothetical protein [Ruminococcus sp.]